jgi:peptide/nickel transport system substrate-binding protein
MTDRGRDLLREFAAGGIGRRQFVRRAAALGLSASTISLALGLPARAAPSPVSIRRSAPVGQAVEGGTLVFGAWQTPDTMDPQKTGLAATSRILVNVFDPLVWHFPGDETPYPGLAESWEVAEDGLSYTFKLRQDVTFHDGEPFNADVVKFTFDRLVDPEAATLAIPPVGYEATEVVDEYTARVVLSKPYAPFLFLLSAGPAWRPIPPKFVTENADQFALTPPGTGPFRITEYQHGSGLTMERFAEYNWAPEGHFGRQGPALLERIDWRIIEESGTRSATLESGETQLVEEVAPAQLEALQANPAYQVIMQDTLGCPRTVHLNCTKAPTDDKLVRQAMAYAFDKRIVTDVIFKGTVEPAWGPLEKLTPGYNPEVESFYAYDPAKANELLDEAGWMMDGEYRSKDGQELSALFIVIAKDNFDETAQVLQSQFKEVGIRLELTTEAEPTVFNTYNRGEQNLANIFWWGADPEALYSLYHSSQIEKGFNWAHYTNEEVDALLEEGYIETDVEKRLDLYEKAQVLIMEDAPAIPVWGKRAIMAGNANFTGLDFNLSVYPLFYDAGFTG